MAELSFVREPGFDSDLAPGVSIGNVGDDAGRGFVAGRLLAFVRMFSDYPPDGCNLLYFLFSALSIARLTTGSKKLLVFR